MSERVNMLRVVDIVDGTTVDGPGFRTSIYFAGCQHHCPGCQNPSTWDPASGKDMSYDEILNRIEGAGFDVTFSGGDPLFQVEALTELADKIRRMGKRIWLFTGFLFETVVSDRKLNKILPYIDVIVDGPYMADKRDTSLLFRGSSNQRLIDVAYWRATGQIRLWESDF